MAYEKAKELLAAVEAAEAAASAARIKFDRLANESIRTSRLSWTGAHVSGDKRPTEDLCDLLEQAKKEAICADGELYRQKKETTRIIERATSARPKIVLTLRYVEGMKLGAIPNIMQGWSPSMVYRYHREGLAAVEKMLNGGGRNG